ncbi:MAG: TIGR03986 family CRISPR-associated RAMP protein [candidate division KSB1 bacterium]
MKLPSHQNPTQEDRTASAPYNFVPLPEIVVPAAKDPESELPDQDCFHTNRKTGYFEVELTAKAPLYVRCALPVPDFLRSESEQEKQRPFRERAKNTPDFFYTNDRKQPVIPGSSLRGMLRNLLEVVSYGKIADVMMSPKIFYRAVAAPKDDPLAEPYRNVLGKFGRNVRAGYLLKNGDDWYIKPAQTPTDLKLPERSGYLTIKEKHISDNAIPGLIGLNSTGYLPQYHSVSFDVEKGIGKFGPVVHVKNIGAVDAARSYQGVMVCSGSMLETGDGKTKSPRSKFAIVLQANKNVTPLKIAPQAITDYRDALTDFQKADPPFDKQMGMLKEGRPIFYVDEPGDEIFYFGHSPNFRIPAMIEKEKRAATPNDFVPAYCKEVQTLDFAEALFGHAKGPESGAKPGDKAYAYASRVFVTDAKCDEQQPWLQASPFVPRILASPKPTAFQHYLVQPNRDEPNKPRQLYHYGDRDKTVIRGRKFYWHQGKQEGISNEDWRKVISEKDETLEEIATKEAKEKYDTQHTQFQPVKPKTKFTFRIYFENLSDPELGALCWGLQPLAHPEFNQQKDLSHRLGMGKPLGMGSVKLNAMLFFTERKARYEKLFDGNGWQTGVRKTEGKPAPESLEHYRVEFEREVLKKLDLYPKHQHLYDLKRIAMLLKLMEWPGPEPEQTRYLMIKNEDGVNEYSALRVLPDPSAFGGLLGAQVVPVIGDKGEPDNTAPSQPAAPQPSQPKPAQQQATTPNISKRKAQPTQFSQSRLPQPPLDTSKDALKMLKAIEKQQRAAEAQAQSVYKNGEVEKKATVVKHEDGTLRAALPKLKDQSFALKPKAAYSQATPGATLRVRIVLDKNNAITRVEEI